MIRLVFFVFVMFLSNADAWIFEECGVYRAQGYLASGKDKKTTLILEKDSESQVNIEFDRFEINDIKFNLNTNVEVLFKIEHPCEYSCNASLVHFIKTLRPYEKPKAFVFPKPKAEKKTKCSQDQ
ncbi:MAG: hypothetical protein A4S09_15670 [Proteobacteria bacterium SG_bin7]|nr:MAG: hypothetical protein A4S09_15670 [Proteobacteria bacterium SG_bin7]